MSAKRTSGALITSLGLHLVLVFIAGIYLITQTPHFQEFIGAEILESTKPPKPTVREPVIKQPIKPIVPTQDTVAVEPVQVKPRVTTVFSDKDIYQPQTVLEFSNQTVKVEAPINPNVPKVVTPNAPVPTAVTHAVLPVSDSPDALAFNAPVASAPSAGPANIGRGVAGSAVQLKVAFERSPGLAMVQHVGAAKSSIDHVDRRVNLGSDEVPPYREERLVDTLSVEGKTSAVSSVSHESDTASPTGGQMPLLSTHCRNGSTSEPRSRRI